MSYKNCLVRKIRIKESLFFIKNTFGGSVKLVQKIVLTQGWTYPKIKSRASGHNGMQAGPPEMDLCFVPEKRIPIFFGVFSGRARVRSIVLVLPSVKIGGILLFGWDFWMFCPASCLVSCPLFRGILSDQN